MLLLFPKVIKEKSLEDLFDYVVHGKELPAHTKKEELGVTMCDQNFVDRASEFMILIIDCTVLEGRRNL